MSEVWLYQNNKVITPFMAVLAGSRGASLKFKFVGVRTE
jgi:hypothetical protein